MLWGRLRSVPNSRVKTMYQFITEDQKEMIAKFLEFVENEEESWKVAYRLNNCGILDFLEKILDAER